ncbi:MAG: LysR family transcriptional regulator [Clostridium fessum]
MDKRDYELLLALDQHKNITKAAQSLYMTQPAITKRIQKMEEELHCPLLIRSKRGVLLTPAAESLLPCARTILKIWSRWKNRCRQPWTISAARCDSAVL